MKMPKQKVQVKVKAESFIIKSTVYTMADGRLSDCTASQKNKFIPAADAGMHYLRDGGKFCVGKRIREVVFINLGKNRDDKIPVIFKTNHYIKKWQEKEIVRLQYG